MNNIIILTSFFQNEWFYYITSAVLVFLVLFGIYLMSKVEKAKMGNIISAVAVFLSVLLILLYNQLLPIWILYVMMGVGTIIGILLTVKVKMIDMPQMIALLNGLGGLASLIVGSFAAAGVGADGSVFGLITAFIAIIIGMITFIGSLVAAGKLHKLLPQKPRELRYHQFYVYALSIVMLAGIIVASIFPSNNLIILISILVELLASAFFGYLFTIRIGGADMPIAISLLNSFSGVAGAISGLAISDFLLVSIGAIVGASGLLLTQIMCKAMNRKLIEILLGKTTVKEQKELKKEEVFVSKSEKNEQNTPYLDVVKLAKHVIIVPGYGMAVAQAQHLLKQVAEQFKAQGATVKYAIHPVAGRMPGHMNVLLAEADVDYDEFYEMDDINDQFKQTDLTIVVGANDVLNPAARENEDTPIYGMPILNVDQCPEIFIFNYDLKPGYSGVPNPLYEKEKGVHLFLGNASDTLKNFFDEMIKDQ